LVLNKYEVEAKDLLFMAPEVLLEGVHTNAVSVGIG